MLLRCAIVSAFLLCATASAHALHGVQDILGLLAPQPIFLGEGPTDASLHPPATGNLKAIMLFAQFPDGEEDMAPRQLYDILVPDAIQCFAEASYGRLQLEVDAHFEWFPMAGLSTDPRYDCSKHEPHKAYITEVVAAADESVDFSAYSLIYIVANKTPGKPVSPTFNAGAGPGFLADGHEIRNAVTFGNDIRGKNWGWQTLVHETGHVLGLPDLYSYEPSRGVYKNLHRHTGSWDPMGYQCHSRHYLAWHKHKLGWIDAADVEVVDEPGERSFEIAHIKDPAGTRAIVLPISDTEALVAEVRHLSDQHPKPGVLIYRVSTTAHSGRGPIRVVPHTPDDDAEHPDLARRYIALYHALFTDGTTFLDEQARIRITIHAAIGSNFRLEVVRTREDGPRGPQGASPSSTRGASARCQRELITARRRTAPMRLDRLKPIAIGTVYSKFSDE